MNMLDPTINMSVLNTYLLSYKFNDLKKMIKLGKVITNLAYFMSTFMVNDYLVRIIILLINKL